MGAIAGIAGGIIGAIGGGAGSPTSSNTASSSTTNLNLQDFDSLNKGSSGLETAGYNAQLSNLSSLTNLVNAGPGQSSVSDANSAASQYGNLLQQFTDSSGLPTSSQTSAAQSYASSIFAPQQTALQQSFIQQQQSGARAAAAMGRSGADPALLGKLGVSETQQQALLNSQQGALASQTAMSLPQQQLQMANNLYNLKQGLATQAMNNRSTLLSLGNQLTASERQYRIQTAGKTTNTQGTSSGVSGGGTGGALAGGLAGIGAGFGAAGALGSMFGGASSSKMMPASNSTTNFGAIA